MIEVFVTASLGFKASWSWKKKILILCQQWKEKNLYSWDENELLFANSKDIRYFFFDAFLLVPAELLSLISDQIQLHESV